jgi:SAM-dependent methyltransferase
VPAIRDADDHPRTVPPDDVAVPSGERLDRWIREYLAHAPLSLTLREINRLIAIEAAGGGGGPVLDVGCGDGFWWTLRDHEQREIYGIDISASEIEQAKTRINASLTDVSAEQPFPGTRFKQIIGNCSLEHVPDIDGALENLRKAAAPGARLAMTIAGAMNGFFQHWHLYDAKVWTRLLAQHGWKVRSVYGLGSARSEFLFRLFMPPAFGEFVVKKLTGKYPSRLAKHAPRALLSPFVKLVRWAVSDPLVAADSSTAYEYMIIADIADP